MSREGEWDAMELSKQEKQSLREHYELEGVEAVRANLASPEWRMMVDPSVQRFAREWVNDTEGRESRLGGSDRLVKFMMVCAVLELGFVVGMRVV
jgi:hypothetical protein